MSETNDQTGQPDKCEVCKGAFDDPQWFQLPGGADGNGPHYGGLCPAPCHLPERWLELKSIVKIEPCLSCWWGDMLRNGREGRGHYAHDGCFIMRCRKEVLKENETLRTRIVELYRLLRLDPTQ